MRRGLWLAAASWAGLATACLVDNPAWIGQSTTSGATGTATGSGDGATSMVGTGGASGDATETEGSTGEEPPRVDLPTTCEPLEPPVDPPYVTVTPDAAADLDQIFAQLPSGALVAFEPGVYDRSGMAPLDVVVRGTRLRSTTGMPSDVWIDGGGTASELMRIRAPGVLIAEIGLRNAADNLLSVDSTEGSMIGPQIYRVAFVNSGGYAMFARADGANGAYVDEGEVACSSFSNESAFRDALGPDCQTGALQGHSTAAWVVRDNEFVGYWCPDQTVAVPAVRFTDDARDTEIVRNRFVDNFRALVLGAGGITGTMCEDAEPPVRVFDDVPNGCDNGQYWGHIGGRVVNNTFWIGGVEIAMIETDSALSLWCACQTEVFHNTFVNLDVVFTSIEYRFARTVVTIANNLAADVIEARDGATALLVSDNVELADLNDFANALQPPPDLDLHLRETAVEAIDAGLILPGGAVPNDFEGDPRSGTPDHGADEYVP